MSFRTIRHAQQKVWPTVRESLDIRRAAREAYAADPQGASSSARTRARIPWNRVVADETVWAMARADLLQSEEATKVVAAARAWVKSWEQEGMVPSGETQDPHEDIQLYRAVQELAASFEPPADEELDNETLSGYRSPQAANSGSH